MRNHTWILAAIFASGTLLAEVDVASMNAAGKALGARQYNADTLTWCRKQGADIDVQQVLDRWIERNKAVLDAAEETIRKGESQYPDARERIRENAKRHSDRSIAAVESMDQGKIVGFCVDHAQNMEIGENDLYQDEFRNLSNEAERQIDVDQILAQILKPDGVLTKEMHRQFWARQRAVAPPGKEREIANAMLRMISTQQEYQLEIWESIRQSYDHGEIVRTGRLLELRSQLVDLFIDNAPFPKDSEDYRVGLARYEQGLSQSDENLEMMLSAAAYREQLVDESGNTFEIDATMIEEVSGGFEAGFRRLKRLLDPQWQGTQ